jgi:hypothetical protein
MKLKIIRTYRKADYTLGDIYVNDVCEANTLEDCDRLTPGSPYYTGVKVYGETAIPAGTYKVIMSHSPKFGRMLPEVIGVPTHSAIRIHSLNKPEQTEGCIGCGLNKIKGQIIESKKYTEKVISAIANAVNNGEEVKLEIV